MWPSGVARAALVAPIKPPGPPAALSITKLVPGKDLPNACCKSRATRSVGPPAAKGTIIVTGLSLIGNSAAKACDATKAIKESVKSFFIIRPNL